MEKLISLANAHTLIDAKIAPSSWVTIDQAMIDKFADATNDHQFIHVDPERAKKETPFGGTIAHGFLTLSLLSSMHYDAVPAFEKITSAVNYGFDSVRFVAPVKTGSRVRAHFTMKEARFRGATMLSLTYNVELEIENEPKPALTAVWKNILLFNPEDRPENV